MKYTYTKTINADRLELEIKTSQITVALDSISAISTTVEINFKSELSAEEKTILDGIVTNHSGLPLADSYVQPVLVESQNPFANPLYRTKIKGPGTLQTCTPGETAELSMQLTETRFCYGGRLRVWNQEPGDMVDSYIEDKDHVIPEQYRAALCDAWPLVRQYLENEPMGPMGEVRMDTRPLIAEIPAGLYIVLKYKAVAGGNERKFVGVFDTLVKL